MDGLTRVYSYQLKVVLWHHHAGPDPVPASGFDHALVIALPQRRAEDRIPCHPDRLERAPLVYFGRLHSSLHHRNPED